MIEGANVPSHGSRDMPIWGLAFSLQQVERYTDYPYAYDSNALVRARILSLLEYRNRIQVR